MNSLFGNTPSVYETKFAKSDKTDAILVVQGWKMHVNKALLSYHSDYFKTLFNSEFLEKSMEEVPIQDVNFVEFATLLSLVQENPIMPTENNVEKLLELADRFLISSVKRQLELFLSSTSKEILDKIRIAEKYQLDEFFKKQIDSMKNLHHYNGIVKNPIYQKLTNKTKIKLFYKLFTIKSYMK